MKKGELKNSKKPNIGLKRIKRYVAGISVNQFIRFTFKLLFLFSFFLGSCSVLLSFYISPKLPLKIALRLCHRIVRQIFSLCSWHFSGSWSFSYIENEFAEQFTDTENAKEKNKKSKRKAKKDRMKTTVIGTFFREAFSTDSNLWVILILSTENLFLLNF